MGLSRIIAVRNFNFTTNTVRWLYHSSRYTVAGSAIAPNRQLGTLVVKVGVVGGVRGPVMALIRPVWGQDAGILGLLLPSANVLQNVFGGTVTPGPSNGVCSIELWLRNEFRNQVVTFTETTNLGPQP